MQGQGFLIEKTKTVASDKGIGPIDTNGAAKTTSWIGLRQGQRLQFKIMAGAWAGGSAAVTIAQATDAAGTGSKAVSFAKRYSIAGDTVTETTVTSNTFNISSANQTDVVEIDASMLDADGGFSYVQLLTASPGANADLLCVTAQVYDLGISGKPSTLPSVLT